MMYPDQAVRCHECGRAMNHKGKGRFECPDPYCVGHLRQQPCPEPGCGATARDTVDKVGMHCTYRCPHGHEWTNCEDR